MKLPNYFLADLPPEAVLSPMMITEACQTLKRNRAQYLASRSTDNLIRLLCGVAEAWLNPDNAFRRLALESGPEKTGFAGTTLQKWSRQFFSGNSRLPGFKGIADPGIWVMPSV